MGGQLETTGILLTKALTYKEAMEDWESIDSDLDLGELLWLSDGIAINTTKGLQWASPVHQEIHGALIDRTLSLIKEIQERFPIGSLVSYSTGILTQWGMAQAPGKVISVGLKPHEVDLIEAVLEDMIMRPMDVDSDLMSLIGVTLETDNKGTATKYPGDIISADEHRKRSLLMLQDMENGLFSLRRKIGQREQAIKELRENLGLGEV